MTASCPPPLWPACSLALGRNGAVRGGHALRRGVPTALSLPKQAARYQMIIMFVISSTTSVSAVACLMSTCAWCLDGSARLRLDRVRKRDKKNGWGHRLYEALHDHVRPPLLFWALGMGACSLLHVTMCALRCSR